MEDQLKQWLKTLKLNESTISMLLGGLVVVVVGILIYNYFTTVDQDLADLDTEIPSDTVELVEEGGKLVPKGLPTSYSVAAGDDLWKIAERFYGSGYNWVDIARENALANPNRVLVGQELNIPKTEVLVPAGEQEEVVKVADSDVITGSNYEVRSGDSLWKIAVRAYQDGYKWPEIAEANKDKVTNPNLIDEGMMLTLPR